MVNEIQNDLDEIIICGRLPQKRDGSVDVYKINRLFSEPLETSERVSILRRLLEYKGRK